MISKKKVILTAAVVLALSIYAFTAGTKLRTWQNSSSLVGLSASTVPTGSVLKLTPELPPDTSNRVFQADEANPNLINNIIISLKRQYVEPITPERETAMARGVVSGIISSLDNPDSRFLDPTQKKTLDDANAGKFHGIGAILTIDDSKNEDFTTSKLIVISPMPGSPAQKAGLLPGDSITHINKKWIVTHNPIDEAGLRELAEKVRDKKVDILEYYNAVKEAEKKISEGMLIPEAVKMLSSDTAGSITLRVDRLGQPKPLEFEMKTSVTKVDPITSSTLDRGIAYIKIAQFTSFAENEFREEYESVKTNQASALVLDLRGNPGGSLNAAANIMGEMTGGGLVGIIRQKDNRKAVEVPKSQKTTLPIVVLINKGTANVAELMVGAMREKLAATIIGTRTFGDGMVQTPLILKDGSAAVITTGEMLTPMGIGFNKHGITPDKQVVQSSEGDAQLDAAKNFLSVKLGKV